MSDRSSAETRAMANPSLDLDELRRLEDHLDWLENQRPRRKLSVLVSPLLPALAVVTAWLCNTGQWQSK